jgi:CheY-like chemotaxis protein
MVAPMNILFVDDSMVFLETFTELCTVLSNRAWGIERAVSVECAIAVLQSKPIALVVVDLGMPMMDGFRLVSQIRQHDPATKIAVMTGDATDRKRDEALTAGAELFLEKPVTPAGIRLVFSRLNDLLDRPPQAESRGTARAAGGPDADFAVLSSCAEKWNKSDERKK